VAHPSAAGSRFIDRHTVLQVAAALAAAGPALMRRAELLIEKRSEILWVWA